MDDGSVLTEKLPSTEDGDESVIYVVRQVPAKRLLYEGTEGTIACTGWTEARTMIFNLCYRKGNMFQRCTTTLRDLEKVIERYQNMKEEDQQRVTDAS